MLQQGRLDKPLEPLSIGYDFSFRDVAIKKLENLSKLAADM